MRAAKTDNRFPRLCVASGLPMPVREFKFHPTRRWKLDYAWPEQQLALEVEGGIWTYGRHNRASGFISDMEKYNELAIMGWRLLRVTPLQMHNLQVINLLKRVF